MSIKLKLETIVPEELYIKRNADKQLKEIIDDMGRPASILVPRQMGKTNLLLNTKREYQDEKNIFVYIDLSTVNNDMRDCFRYIIDTAIKTNLNLLEKCESKIEKIREKDQLANREHEHELLILLREFNGKIIICLDEIDSMVDYDFSDQFFSQIRSVYFASRTNYPEFKQLTYILSGVLEPSEIINDSRKSPFNISEKIYLNDFSKEEYYEFIHKANLPFLSKDNIEDIYEWTSGHPRMIWDVLLKIRDRHELQTNISKDDIDNIIEFLYLEHSDIPPIDHIRNLVKKNIEISKILLELKNNIEINISNEMKNKLYLFGLINYSKSKKTKIKIKNKIIDKVLNSTFLKEVLYSSQSPFEVGMGFFKKGEFSKAITEFVSALNSEDLEDEKEVVYYLIGACFFHLMKYEDSLKYLNLADKSYEEGNKFFYEQENIKGLCHLQLGNTKDSLDIFNALLKYEFSNKYTVHINIANVLLSNYNKEHKRQIEEHLKKSLDLIDNSEKTDNEWLSKLYRTRALLAIENTNHDKAIQEYKKILDLKNIEHYKVNTLLELCNLDSKNKNKYLDKIYENIISKHNYVTSINDPMEFSFESISKVLYEFLKVEKYEMLRTFLNYIVSSYSEFESKCDIVTMVINKYKDEDKIIAVILYAIDNFESSEISSQECYLGLYFIIMKIANKNKNIELIKKYFKKYINLLENRTQIEQTYIILIDNLISSLIQEGETVFASSIFKDVEQISLRMPFEINILKVSLYDKSFELKNTFEEKIRISYRVLRELKENSKDIDLIQGRPHNHFRNIKMKHDLYIFNNKNKLNFRRKDPCPCGSGKPFKNCCRDI